MKKYCTDLNDLQWQIIEKIQNDHRIRRHKLRNIWNAVFYITKSGCQWRMLPSDFAPWQTVYYYFRKWKMEGLIEEIHDMLVTKVRINSGKKETPTVGIIDSQSVKTTLVAGESRGYDAGKKTKGRKRHIIVDTMGLLLAVVVHSADIQDRDGAKMAMDNLLHKLPLNASTIEIEDPGNWKVEKITIDAAYNNERFDIWLFLPKDVQPPYQPVLLYHASNVIYYDAFNVNYVRSLEFIVQSGRALVFPVLKGTCERRDGLNTDYQQPTVFYKDHVLMWRKDFGRTIDYLETRSDIFSNKIGFFGWSWGGFMGGVMPAVENRIKAVVLHVGGMEMTRALPEVDQINFLPRVRQPVLMLNGEYDMFFPVESTQKPMFDFLGTPDEDKKIIIYDTGHLVPRNELIKETLAWYDKYLGSVK